MSKGRLIEGKFIADLQAEVTRLTRQVTRLNTRIRALKHEIACHRRDDGEPSEPVNARPACD